MARLAAASTGNEGAAAAPSSAIVTSPVRMTTSLRRSWLSPSGTTSSIPAPYPICVSVGMRPTAAPSIWRAAASLAASAPWLLAATTSRSRHRAHARVDRQQLVQSDKLLEQRARWGISHYTVRPDTLDQIAPVLAGLS